MFKKSNSVPPNHKVIVFGYNMNLLNKKKIVLANPKFFDVKVI